MDKKINNQISIERVIKAFANKKRLQLIEILYKNPSLSVEIISEKLEMEYKMASFHLSKLAMAGIVTKKPLGNNTLHTLTNRGKSILKFVRTLE